MAGTFTQIIIHIVFSTKHREKYLDKDIRDEVFKYISGIIENKKCKPLAINGYYDHIHILLGLDPSVSLSDLVKEIKRCSTNFIKSKKMIKKNFAWQGGYSAFSYSRSQIDVVIKYIMNQETHHSTRTFKEEYLDMLKKFSIEFEEKYIFD